MDGISRGLFARLRGSAVFREYTMLVVLAALVLLGACVSDKFLTMSNLMNLLKQYSVIGIVSLGVTFVTIGGTRELTVGSLVSLTGAVAVQLQSRVGEPLAVLGALLVGACVGLLTGSIIAATRSDVGASFIITFGMLSVVFALAMLVTKGFTLTSRASGAYHFLGNGMLLGVLPMPVVLFLALALALNALLTRTKLGRQIYYMGENLTVARLSGVKVERLQVFVYGLTGLLTAFAGIILSARTQSASATMGVNYEMDVLAAIAVGGVSLYGGRGTLWNTVIGIFVIGVLSNIFSMLGMSKEAQLMAKGVIIIVAVCIENVKTGKKREL